MKKSTKEDTLRTLVIGLSFTCLMLLGTIIWMGSSLSEASEILSESDVVAEQAEIIEIEVVDEPTYTEEELFSYTGEELFYMAAAIYNEAGADTCSDDTRRLVGYVILNRVNDPRYPNTIKGVLEQRSQYGRFHWTGIKFADRASLPQEKHAVERAYRIAKECLQAEPIPIPKTVVFQAEFEQGVELYSYQDGMYFCHAQEVK